MLLVRDAWALCWFAAAGALACGGDAATQDVSVKPPPGESDPAAMPMAPACPWESEGLLAKVGVVDAQAPRVDCGRRDGAAGLQAVLNCFADARARGTAAEFTRNYCIDCYIAGTFVTLPTGDLFQIFVERDTYGDALRESSVDACSGVSFAGGIEVTCLDPVRLFACQGALSDVPI
ncbi:MAG: hypothetical protein RL685_3440 [Pseudomonadota bacterium]|jgi:hypothetical protein